MQNQRFYIKYQNCDLVFIETHFIGEQERKRPLLTICHLIYAYQSRPASILANTFSGMLKFYSSIDGPFIPNYILLNSLDASVGTFDNPFFIKQCNQFY